MMCIILTYQSCGYFTLNKYFIYKEKIVLYSYASIILHSCIVHVKQEAKYLILFLTGRTVILLLFTKETIRMSQIT